MARKSTISTSTTKWVVEHTNKQVSKWSSLVRIAPQTWLNDYHESVKEREKESSGPGAIWTLDPRHVKAVS